MSNLKANTAESANFSRYGWVIDVDHLADGPDDSRVGIIGPCSIPSIVERHFQLGQCPLAVERWRCKDSDGNVYYEGRYAGPGDERMFGPLQDFAMPDAGASEIEYLDESGLWVSL